MAENSKKDIPAKYAGRKPKLVASLDTEELSDRFAEVEFDGKTYYVDEPNLESFIAIQALMEQMEDTELDDEEAIDGIEKLRDMLVEIAPTFAGCKLNFRRVQKVIEIFSELVEMPEDSVLEEMGVKERIAGGGGQKKDESPS